MKPNAREPLATLGHLNMPIQSEAVLMFPSRNLTLAFLKTASDWIGTFKGSNVCD